MISTTSIIYTDRVTGNNFSPSCALILQHHNAYMQTISKRLFITAIHNEGPRSHIRQISTKPLRLKVS